MKRRETVFADKTAMKASNTIYDIVSLTKGEVFPTEFFGDLVSVVIVSRAAHGMYASARERTYSPS